MSDIDVTEPGPFEQKNRDRRAARAMVGRTQFLDARRLRRHYSWGRTPGAFGYAPARYWNQLIIGTFGVSRSAKGDES